MSLIKDGKVYRTTEEQVAWLTKIKYNSYQKEDIDKIVATLNQEIDTKAGKQEVNQTVATLNQEIDTKAGKQEVNVAVATLNQEIDTKAGKQEVNVAVATLNQEIDTKAGKQEVNQAVETLNQKINTKQDKLNFDTTPTANSTNPVTSGGVYNAIETEKQEVNGNIETLNQKINTKQDKLNFDTTPTENSTNPVTSGGVYNSISQKTTTKVNGVITDLEFNSDPQTQIGNLSSLETTDKTSLVNSINEVKNSIGENAADYIIEQGTSGIWTYRKWNSGLAECFGKYSGTVLHNATWNDFGQFKSTIVMQSVDYPFTFTSVPNEFATLGRSYYGFSNSLFYPDAFNLSTKSGTYRIAKPNKVTGTENISVILYVVGIWK